MEVTIKNHVKRTIKDNLYFILTLNNKNSFIFSQHYVVGYGMQLTFCVLEGVCIHAMQILTGKKGGGVQNELLL
jgi:hypothetical protein